MKRTLSIVFVLMLSIGLTACGETKEEKTVNNIVNIAEKSGEKVDDQTKEIMKNAINNSEDFQNEIADEMVKMPKIIKVFKVYRKCLGDADDKDEAITCYEEADKMADDLGIEEDNEDEFNADEEFGDWSTEKKKSVLSEMDMDMKNMEQFMK